MELLSWLNILSDKNKYSGYGIEFDSSWSFLFSDGGGFSKNIIMFGANMSSSLHTSNKKKDSLIFDNDPADCLDATTLNAEKIYNKKNFAEQQK